MKPTMIVVLVAVVCVVGLKMALRCPTIAPCPDAADQLALDRLSPVLGTGTNYLDVWISHNYSDDYWQPRFRDRQAKLDGLRAWASKIEDRCARAAYLHWLDFYQNQLNSTREELRTHELEKKMNDDDRQRSEERERMKAYSERVDGAFPYPPKDDR